MKGKIILFICIIIGGINLVNASTCEVVNSKEFYDGISNCDNIVVMQNIYLDDEYLDVADLYLGVFNKDNLIIDLNGYNIFGLSLLINNSDVSIINTSNNKSIISSIQNCEIILFMGGNLNIDNINFQFNYEYENAELQAIHVTDGNLSLSNSYVYGNSGLHLDNCENCNINLINDYFDNRYESIISYMGNITIDGGSFISLNRFALDLYRTDLTILDGQFNGYYGGLFYDEYSNISIENGIFSSMLEYGAISSSKIFDITLINESFISDYSYSTYTPMDDEFEFYNDVSSIYALSNYIEIGNDLENNDVEENINNNNNNIIENPKTGDSIMLFFLLFLISIIFLYKIKIKLK